MRRISLCKFVKWLIRSPENIVVLVSESVAARPAVAETECYPRMEGTEKATQESALEYARQDFITRRNRSQPISVAETEFASVDFPQAGLLKYAHSH